MSKPHISAIRDVAHLAQLREELDRMTAIPEIHTYRFVRAILDVTLDQEARIQTLQRQVNELYGMQK